MFQEMSIMPEHWLDGQLVMGVPESHAHTGDFSIAVSTSIPTLAWLTTASKQSWRKKYLPAELCLALLPGCTTQPFLPRLLHLCLWFPFLPSSSPLLPPAPISLHRI